LLAAIGLGTALGIAVFGIIGVVIALLAIPDNPSRATHNPHPVMTTSQLGRMVGVLLIVAAMLFSVGTFYEHGEGDRHQESAESTEGSEHNEAAESIRSRGAQRGSRSVRGVEQKLLGVDVESPWLIGLLDHVWDRSERARTESLRVLVNQPRRRLQENPAAPWLLTEPGVGYRLVDGS
jgi:hypothetical protein